MVVFSLTSIAHLYQGIRSKQWYWLCTAFVCGVLEILGVSSEATHITLKHFDPDFGFSGLAEYGVAWVRIGSPQKVAFTIQPNLLSCELASLDNPQ